MIGTFLKLNKSAKKRFEEFGNQEIRVRRFSYKGKGRPKKSDYSIVKRKDLLDFYCWEMISVGTTTHYTT